MPSARHRLPARASLSRALRGAVLARIAALALAALVLARPALAFEVAGWQTDSRCCCPSPADCHCPGHDSPNERDALRKCGNSGQLQAPVILALLAPQAPVALAAPTAMAIPTPPPAPSLTPQHVLEPETPPF